MEIAENYGCVRLYFIHLYATVFLTSIHNCIAARRHAIILPYRSGRLYCLCKYTQLYFLRLYTVIFPANLCNCIAYVYMQLYCLCLYAIVLPVSIWNCISYVYAQLYCCKAVCNYISNRYRQLYSLCEYTQLYFLDLYAIEWSFFICLYTVVLSILPMSIGNRIACLPMSIHNCIAYLPIYIRNYMNHAFDNCRAPHLIQFQAHFWRILHRVVSPKFQILCCKNSHSLDVAPYTSIKSADSVHTYSKSLCQTVLNIYPASFIQKIHITKYSEHTARTSNRCTSLQQYSINTATSS